MNLPLLIAAFSFLLSIFSLLYFRSYLKRRTSQEAILGELREEVNNILKSINETTDRDISLIEDSGKRLRDLLEEIDKRFKVYIREMERFGSPGPAASENRKSEVTYEELGKKRYSLARQNVPQATEKSMEAVTDIVSGKESAYPIPNFDLKTELPPLPLSEQINSLLHSGFSSFAIASRLGISIAEVEFAAALLERREDPWKTE